jgi:hypothetical protein
MTFRAVVSTAVTVGLLLSSAACSGSSPDEVTSSPVSPVTTSPTASGSGGTQSLDGAPDPLPSGRYAKPDFTPALSFGVGAGWHAVQDSPGFFDVQREPGTLDVVAVQFARLPDVSTARDVLDELRGRDGLTIRSTEEHRLGGLPATRIVVDNVDPDLQAQDFTDALTAEPGTLSIASGRRLQIDVMDTPDGLLAILVGGSVRRWAATERVAEPVVQSVELTG